MYNEVELGKSLEIMCKGRVMEWFFYRKCYPSTVSNKRNHFSSSVLHQDNMLYIVNATVEHQGPYVCYGLDEYETEFFSATEVLVLRKFALNERIYRF